MWGRGSDFVQPLFQFAAPCLHLLLRPGFVPDFLITQASWKSGRVPFKEDPPGLLKGLLGKEANLCLT